MSARMARTIPIDKHEIRELAKELEGEILEAVSRHKGSLGKRIISQRPHTFRAVDGSFDVVQVRLEAVPARGSNFFILSGGLGTTSRGTSVVVVFVNGSMDGQDMANGARTRLVQLQIYPVLLHELTHAADKFTKGVGEHISEQDLQDNPAVYYNHPSEVRAYMQAVVDEASERFKYYERLKKNFGSRAVNTLLNMSTTWQEVSPHWTSRNQQKVMKTVYQALEDWQRAQVVTARVIGFQCHAEYVVAGVADGVGDVHHRVLSRYLDAKSPAKGKALVPDYQKAFKALESGDEAPMNEFALSTARIILPVPGGALPDWFTALGTVKRNAILGLYKEFGRYNRAREGMLANDSIDAQRRVRVLEHIAKEWGKAVRTLEIATAVTDVALEIKHGPFTVIPVPGLTKKQVVDALAALDTATEKLRPKCPRVLYGKVFFSTTLQKGVAARYVEQHDTLYLNVRAKKRFDDIFTIIHELGHRHEAKFLSKAGHDEYWDLSTRKVYETIHFDAKLRDEVADECVLLAQLKGLGKPLPTLSEPLILWLKSPHPHEHGDVRALTTAFLKGEIDERTLHAAIKSSADHDVMTDKVLHEPLHVTPYGGTKPSENYADGFAHFILGMDMPSKLAEILAEELK